MTKICQEKTIIDGRECVSTIANGKIVQDKYLDYVLDKPSGVGYYLDGTIHFEQFYNAHSYLHRVNGPSEIQYIYLEKEFVVYWFGSELFCFKYIVDDTDCLMRVNLKQNDEYIWQTNYSKNCIDNKIKRYYLLGEYISEEQFNTPGFIDAFILEHS